ncbi:hypothetical protein MJO29_010693 [Puccinia striiformis f. sp. tritici]|nr:hypothetical protein MJO29_010693 [Puccinia striiformis f. sp. tritici]
MRLMHNAANVEDLHGIWTFSLFPSGQSSVSEWHLDSSNALRQVSSSIEPSRDNTNDRCWGLMFGIDWIRRKGFLGIWRMLEKSNQSYDIEGLDDPNL